jgi:hypothetical protein
MVSFLVKAGQTHCMEEYLACWGSALAGRMQVIPYETLADEVRLVPGTYVFGALDHWLEPELASRVHALAAALAGRPGFRVLNDPARALRRRDLLDRLYREGRNVFRAERATGDLRRLRFPVFLRNEHRHDRPASPLLHSVRQVEGAVAWAVLTGHRLEDLLVVEFCDTSDAKGVYRKYAAFVVGERVIARSLSHSRHWMVKHGVSDFSRDAVTEELEYVRGNPHAAQLAGLFRLAGVSYGRIDYSLHEGRVQAWEINLNPTIGRGHRPTSGRVPSDLEPIRRQSKAHFYREFQSAWEAVDLPCDGDDTTLAFGPACGGGAGTRRARWAGRGLRRVKRALGPGYPVLYAGASWAAARVLAPLGRALRHNGSSAIT